MKNLYFLLSGLFFMSGISNAQNTDMPESDYHKKGPASAYITLPGQTSFSGYSGTGANMNVVYQRINWNIDPTDVSKNISGSVTTHFRTLVANVSTLTFDLNQVFNNAATIATFHGITCTRTLSLNILTITLPSTINTINTLDSVTINYAGIPPNAVGAAQGYTRKVVAGAGAYISTLSESYEDRDWWPCKADMQDKIDAMDIYVTVPWNLATSDTFWVASNGKLIDSTITGTSRTFYFQTRYPIPSYLVAVSVAKFDRFYRSVMVGTSDVPIVYNLLTGKTPGTVPGILSAMDKVTPVLSALSNKIGEYPFKLEKHGFYDGLIGAGGMEHQTFSAIASTALTSVKTLVHELAHQWFGDNVTFANWNDLWLAEGFARYSESYAGELSPATGINPYTTRLGFRDNALLSNASSAWIPDGNASSSDLIWNSSYGTTVYERGAMIISMLRVIAGDAKFSQAMTNYQTDLAGKSVTTDSLRNHFNRVLGQDISGFFNDYVGGSGKGPTAVGGIGNPIHNILWGNPSAKTFRVSVGAQGKSAGSNVTYFNGPIVLHVTNASSAWTKDTTIVIYDWGGGNLSYAGNGLTASQPGNMLQYTLSFIPTNVFIDDSARTLSAAGTVSKVSILAMPSINFSVKPGSDGNLASLITDNITETPLLERSANSTAFTPLHRMMEMAITGAKKKYVFTDNMPLPGNNFYRAIFKDAEGVDQYSKIIKVNGAQSDFQIVNNPINKFLKIRCANTFSQPQLFGFQIYDACGKLIMQTVRPFSNYFIELDTKNLSKGNYVVQIISGNVKQSSLQFIVE